jgi:hypothetical protein
VKGVQIDDAGAVARPSVPSGIPTGQASSLWLAISRSVSAMACGAPRGRLSGVEDGSPLVTSGARMDGAIGPKAHDPLPPTLPAARSR